MSIVDTRAEALANKDLGQVSLATITGKQRDFHFDYVFGEDSTQDYVYDQMARPVVSEVLRGFNGTIFAYGQTGTGKTYTMGILEFVSNEHAGLIPRAILQVFEHVGAQSEADIKISLSFVQLYRETIQDLLVQPNGVDDNLIIRENPQMGFYVEGLQNILVQNYREAEALINMGLENRAIAPTLMNSTSSRSHTVLTLQIEQRLSTDPSNPQSYGRTLRSKLLMVDLAGSERVRRTVSKGTRLSEAKSINSSLSALGNVIAALAENNTHVPYRDSKLTRLLQDSLGGNAATALIATIGPAAVNYGETLSTLLFAQRCMAVKIAPVAHEEVDYAELCAKLQLQLSTIEETNTAKLLEQQDHYEKVIRDLNDQLEAEREQSLQLQYNQSVQGGGGDGDFSSELGAVLQQLQEVAVNGQDDVWFNRPEGWDMEAFLAEHDGHLQGLTGNPDAQLVMALGYCHELLRFLLTSLDGLLVANADREGHEKDALAEQFDEEARNDRFRMEERAAMLGNDPKYLHQDLNAVCDSGSVHTANTLNAQKIGSHLAPLSKLEAMNRVEGQFRSNNAPLSRYDRRPTHPLEGHADLQTILRPALHEYSSLSEFCGSLTQLHSLVAREVSALQAVLCRKDEHYQHVKAELTEQMVERRRREEEVVNWSYILKYLLASASKLRKQIKQDKKRLHQLHGGNEATEVDTISVSSAHTGQTGQTDIPPPPPPMVGSDKERVGSIGEASVMGRLFTPMPAPAITPTPARPVPTTQHTNVPRVPRPAQLQRPSRVEDEDDFDQLGSRSVDSEELSLGSSRPRRDTAASSLSSNTASYLHTSNGASVSSRKVSTAAVSTPPSDFAQQVAYKVLGIRDDSQARQAMAIIDQVQHISPQQMQMLDEATRQQILQIRKELGINGSNEPSKARSSSAPRSRPPLVQEQQRGRSREPRSVSPTEPINRRHAPSPSVSSSVRSTGSRMPPQRPPVYAADSDEDDDNFSQLDFAESRR